MWRLHIWHRLWDVNTINSKETTTRHLASNLPWTSFALKPDLAATPLTRNISGDYIVLIRLIYIHTPLYIIIIGYYKCGIVYDNQYIIWQIYIYIIYIYINIDIPWFIWSCEAKNLPYFFLFLSFLGALHAHSPQAQTDCGSLQSPVCSQIWRLPRATCRWMCLSCCQISKDQTIPPSKKNNTDPSTCSEVVIFQMGFDTRVIKIMSIEPSIAIGSGRWLKWPSSELGLWVHVSHACKL